jgi:hypothetical protein
VLAGPHGDTGTAARVLRRRDQTAVELLRREPQLDRLRLLSCVVAPGEQMPRRSQRALVEAEPAP